MYFTNSFDSHTCYLFTPRIIFTFSNEGEGRDATVFINALTQNFIICEKLLPWYEKYSSMLELITDDGVDVNDATLKSIERLYEHTMVDGNPRKYKVLFRAYKSTKNNVTYEVLGVFDRDEDVDMIQF